MNKNNLEYFSIAENEVKKNIQDGSLWHKALTLTAGDKDRAKDKYIRLRILHLKKGGVSVPSEKEIIVAKRTTTKKISKVKKEKQPQTEEKSFGMRFLQWGMGLVVLVVIIFYIGYVQNNSSTDKGYAPIIMDGKYALTIKTNPYNAKVRILNINPKYKDGIRLDPDDYHIEITKKGYIKELFWVTLDKDTNKKINLQRDGKTFSVNVKVSPSNAIIKITNINPKFYQGIMLKKGAYLLEVSRNGYDTKKEWINLRKDYYGSITLTKTPFSGNVLSYTELKWCIDEQNSIETFGQSVDKMSYSLDRYSQSAIDDYNKEVNKLNSRNTFWNTRCKGKKYKQDDYRRLSH